MQFKRKKKKRIIIGSPIRADRNRVRRARIARSNGILNKFRIVSGGGSLTAILRGEEGRGPTIKERSFTVAMFRQSLSFIIIITISETFLLFSTRKEFLLYFYLFRERERERGIISYRMK